MELLFLPSGEIMKLSYNQFRKLESEYLTIDYDHKYGYYVIEDNYKEMIMLVLSRL